MTEKIPKFVFRPKTNLDYRRRREWLDTRFFDNRFQLLIQRTGDPIKARTMLYESLDPTSKMGFEFDRDDQGKPIRVSRAYSYDADRE